MTHIALSSPSQLYHSRASTMSVICDLESSWSLPHLLVSINEDCTPSSRCSSSCISTVPSHDSTPYYTPRSCSLSRPASTELSDAMALNLQLRIAAETSNMMTIVENADLLSKPTARNQLETTHPAYTRSGGTSENFGRYQTDGV